jgi:3-oxoacyl-[acyl-carrier protein] reductase
MTPPISEKYTGNVALVTGAGSGVGRATAIALARSGMLVGLVGRNLSSLAQTAHLIDEEGGTALACAADIGEERDVLRAEESVTTELGPIRVLVNAAAIGVYGPVEGYSLDNWQRTLSTNLTGVFLCSRSVVPGMRAAGGGAIIAIGSGAGKQGYATLAAYSASKFGLIGFMESLAAEVGADGIKVSTIHPGSILTSFGGRSVEEKLANKGDRKYIEPEDVADAVLCLLGQPDHAWTQEMNLWPF